MIKPRKKKTQIDIINLFESYKYNRYKGTQIILFIQTKYETEVSQIHTYNLNQNEIMFRVYYYYDFNPASTVELPDVFHFWETTVLPSNAFEEGYRSWNMV